MDFNNLTDLSSYFLVEFSADSEADSEPVRVDLADDDAESCRRGFEHFQAVTDLSGCDVEGNTAGVAIASLTCSVDGPKLLQEEEKEEGEEVNSHDKWVGEKRLKKVEPSVLGCTDSFEEEMMSEMEKSKLFWETCLGS